MGRQWYINLIVVLVTLSCVAAMGEYFDLAYILLALAFWLLFLRACLIDKDRYKAYLINKERVGHKSDLELE